MKSRNAVRAESERTRDAPARGRPRDQKSRLLILRTARTLLNEGGLGAVTMEALVTHTGISKPTIYRTWPNAHAVVMSALMDAPASKRVSVTEGGSSIEAIRAQLKGIVDVFSSRTGRSITHILAAADPSTELSKVFRNHFILARREEGRTLLRDAVSNKEIRPDINLEVVLDQLYAPIFYRILVGHLPLNDEFVTDALRELMMGWAPAGRTTGSLRRA